MSNNPLPLVAPLFPVGKEPLPPGWTEEDRDNAMQAKKFQNLMQMGMESCVAKTAIAGVGGTSVCAFSIRMSQNFDHKIHEQGWPLARSSP